MKSIKKAKTDKTENIMFFCAHNDDNIIGGGGTVAKYAKEGKTVYTIFFSFGESSHPHLKPEVITKTRVSESKKASEILGEKSTEYLGLREGHFYDDVKDNPKISEKIKKMIVKKNPSKIFMHSIDDPHPDHQAAHHIIMEILDDIRYKGETYSFSVWNPIHIRKSGKPKLVVDVTDTFDQKIRAMKAHKSQMMTRIVLWWNIYLKSMYNGLNNGVKYAEVFYKIR